MKVLLNKEGYENRPLFLMYISEKDTLKILDSPHFLNGLSNNIRFQLADRGEPIDNPVFKLEFGTPEVYVMYGKTGFKTNKDHLKYLIELGPIKMIFGENDTCVGYVKIENQDLYIKEQIKKLKSLSDPKETERSWEKRYGNNFSNCYYFKEGKPVGKIYKTNRKVDHIQIGEEVVF